MVAAAVPALGNSSFCCYSAYARPDIGGFSGCRKAKKRFIGNSFGIRLVHNILSGGCLCLYWLFFASMVGVLFCI